MKTIRLRIAPDPTSTSRIEALCIELTKLWNLARAVALHNHSLTWWKWAEKQPDIDLAGCTRTVIHLGKKSAWVGASSRIAEGGGRWTKDPKATVPTWKRVARTEFAKAEASGLECRENAEGECFIRAYAPLYRYHPDLKNPWKAIAPREFEYIRVPSANGGGAELTAINKLDNMGHLAAFGVEIPKGASTFACGLLKDLEASHKAWIDTKRANAHKPRYRDPLVRLERVQSLACPEVGVPRLLGNKIQLGGFLGAFDLFPGEADRVPDGMLTRTYRLVHDASGWYACVVFATPAESEVVLLKARVKFAKKLGPDAVAEAQAALESAQKQLELERHNPGNGKVLGIDPGVVRNLTCHDGQRTFHVKLKLSRGQKNAKTDRRIEHLQRKLAKVKTANNKRLGLAPDARRSAGTIVLAGNVIELKNEAKLAQKIARLQLLRGNRRNAYQHRIATRLFKGGYSEIRIEKTQTSNIARKAKPKMAEDGSYSPNGGSAKTGLNRSLADAAISAQREKLATRFTPAGRTFTLVSAAGTSSKCRECGGKHEQLERFVVCRTSGCSLEGIQQDRDDAAAQHIWQRADR